MSSAKRCIWLMEELGLPHEIIRLNMQDKEHKGEAYLALNPNGKVPTLIDGEYVIWESTAINVYLGEKYGPEMLGSGAEERGLVAQWSFWSHGELHAAIEPLIMKKFGDGLETEITKQAPTEIAKRFAILDKALEGKEYLVAGRFTVADINVATAVGSHAWLDLDISSFKNIGAWLARVEGRPAFQKISTPAA